MIERWSKGLVNPWDLIIPDLVTGSQMWPTSSVIPKGEFVSRISCFGFSRVKYSESLRLMGRTFKTTWCLEPGCTHTLFWVEFQLQSNPVDSALTRERPNWLLYAFHRNGLKWLFCTATFPYGTKIFRLVKYLNITNPSDGYLVTIPIMSIHVPLAWHSRPCCTPWKLEGCFGRSAVRCLVIGFPNKLGQWPNPSRTLSDGISPLGPVAVFGWILAFWASSALNEPGCDLAAPDFDQTLRCENAWHFITHLFIYMTPS